MAVRTGRDPDRLAAELAPWLAARLQVSGVEISQVTIPKAGYSNETIFFTAGWQADGEARRSELVVRIEPTSHQLFVKPDAMSQAAMMTALARHPGTPVPRVLFTEQDPSVLGAPFFVMQRLHGRTPADMPSWHQQGWTTELSPAQLSAMYDSGIRALAALHRIDWHDGFGFLARGRAGPAWPRYLDELDRWYQWSQPSRIFDADQLDAAYRHVRSNAPEESTESIVWGDARVGNMLFSSDLQVIAMFDWETATLGPPGIDLGWWLMFEDFLSDAQGVTKLPGTPDRAEIIRRYEQATGRVAEHVDYYELLACVVMSLINSRLGELLMRNHGMSAERAGEYARRTIRMASQRLACLNGRT